LGIVGAPDETLIAYVQRFGKSGGLRMRQVAAALQNKKGRLRALFVDSD
jgi:hypothetical protein